jgi:hypothetical protein
MHESKRRCNSPSHVIFFPPASLSCRGTSLGSWLPEVGYRVGNLGKDCVEAHNVLADVYRRERGRTRSASSNQPST